MQRAGFISRLSAHRAHVDDGVARVKWKKVTDMVRVHIVTDHCILKFYGKRKILILFLLDSPIYNLQFL